MSQNGRNDHCYNNLCRNLLNCCTFTIQWPKWDSGKKITPVFLNLEKANPLTNKPRCRYSMDKCLEKREKNGAITRK